MEIKVDVGIASISKQGEEVCGDTTRVIETGESTTVILSDGLGSGIKASILSILSTQIAARLLKTNLGLEQVFATIADTLPICKVRDIAYSTLSILKVSKDGKAHLIEYDNPSLILIRKNELVPVKKRKRTIAGKDIDEAFFEVEVGDILLLVSDGVINAGVGGLFDLGLGRDRLLENIFKRDLYREEAEELAKKIIGLTEACYLGKPGDDSTSIVVKPRKLRSVTVLTGPPEDRKLDREVVKRFLDFKDSEKIICGGATGNMVSREMDSEIETSLEYIDSSVPPVASIEGIDLVTEGILTLNKSFEMLNHVAEGGRLGDSADGATALSRRLLKADMIRFIMGRAVNPAHEELMQSLQLKPRPEIVGKMVKKLREMGKNVDIEVY